MEFITKYVPKLISFVNSTYSKSNEVSAIPYEELEETSDALWDFINDYGDAFAFKQVVQAAEYLMDMISPMVRYGVSSYKDAIAKEKAAEEIAKVKRKEREAEQRASYERQQEYIKNHPSDREWYYEDPADSESWNFSGGW